MTKSGIYLIRHKTEANLVYVGKSIDIDQRWKQHIKGHRSAKKLQEAFSEHGVNSFEFQILEEIDTPSEMSKRETYYIDLYDSWKNGLNGSRAGGEWGRHARGFVKNPDGFKAIMGQNVTKHPQRKLAR